MATQPENKSQQHSGRVIDVSIIIVNYNTKDLLRRCLQSIIKESQGINREILVVDNGSTDGSPDVVLKEFPAAKLIRSEKNLGFGAANNIAFKKSRGRHVVLLNTDAFINPGSLSKAILKMDADSKVGLAGGKLISEDGSWQPSARMFPSPLNDFLQISGLASKYPKSRFFGRADRTWANGETPTETDWVPGAFSIIRRTALDKIGFFDERFFLYFEEVDLCNRMKEAGYLVCYWPDVVITHLGGVTTKLTHSKQISKKGSQSELWRTRSSLLYYRKHWGCFGAWLSYQVEKSWHWLRILKNRFSNSSESQEKVSESSVMINLLNQAWNDTKGGKMSPPTPW